MNFDDTLTDLERVPLIDPDAPWLPQAEGSEPDLEVDGLPGSIMSRLRQLFLRRQS